MSFLQYSPHLGAAMLASVLIAAPVSLRAQTGRLSAYGGVTFSTAEVDEQLSLSSRRGYTAGGRFELGLIDQLGLRFGVEYSQQGARYDYQIPGTSTSADANVQIDYLNLPVNLKMNFFGPDVVVYLVGGTTLGAILSATQTTEGIADQDVKDQLNTFDITGDVGLGVEFAITQDLSAQLESKFSFGLLDLAKQSKAFFNTSSWKARNAAIVLGIGYRVF